MHYIGSMTPGETLHTLFQQLGIDDDLPLSPLDPMGYDGWPWAGSAMPLLQGVKRFSKRCFGRFQRKKRR